MTNHHLITSALNAALIALLLLMSACSSAPTKQPKQVINIPLQVRTNGVYQQRIEHPNRLSFNYFQFLDENKVLALYDFKGEAKEAVPLFAKMPQFFAYDYHQQNNQLVLTNSLKKSKANTPPLSVNAQGYLQHVSFLNIRNQQLIYKIQPKPAADKQLLLYQPNVLEAQLFQGSNAVLMAHQRIRISQAGVQQLYDLTGHALGKAYSWIATEFVQNSLLAYNGSHFGLLDKNAKVLVPFIYDDIQFSAKDNSILASIKDHNTLFNTDFEVILSGKFYKIGARTIHNLIPIQKKRQQKWQFFSIKNKSWLDLSVPQYQNLNNPNYFQVTTSRGDIVVNTQGKPALSMYVNQAQILDDGSFLAQGLTDMSSRFNAQGKRLMPFFKENLTALGNLIQVQDKQQLGLVDTTGQQIIPIEFKQIIYLGDDLYKAIHANGEIKLYQSKQAPYALFAQEQLNYISPLVKQRLVIHTKDSSIIFDTRLKNIIYQSETLKIAPFASSGYATYFDQQKQTQGLINLNGQLLGEANYHHMQLVGEYLLATDKLNKTALYQIPELTPIATIETSAILSEPSEQHSYALITQAKKHTPVAPKKAVEQPDN